jgi:DeoR family transcriptional regulator, suf operon transcriptional repressor
MTHVWISPAALRIIRLLVGQPARSVAELIRATDLTRTAITEQLDELMQAGFVERAVERSPSRGRPRHLYQATNAALVLLFPGNQQLVVPALWRAILDIGGESMTKKVSKRVSRAMAEHYSSQITAKKPRERLRQLIALLAAEGGVADLVETKDGKCLLQKRTCPFVSMIDEQRSVCRVDQEMISAVVGSPVRRTGCRHEGAACCTFEIAAE